TPGHGNPRALRRYRDGGSMTGLGRNMSDRCSQGLAAVGPRCIRVGHEPGEHARVAWQLEVVDAGIVGQAEVPAVHSGPHRHRVVRQVLLVEVAVTREEL